MKGRVSVLVLLVCALFAGLGHHAHGDRYAVPGDGQTFLASRGSIESGFASIVAGLPASEVPRPSRDGDDPAAPDVSPLALPQPVASGTLLHARYSAPLAEPHDLHPPVRGPPTA